MKGKNILPFAQKYIGSKYILGAYVPKNQAKYKGAFDCAEFAAYLIYQTYGILYGTELNNFSRKLSDDAYTGYFNRDALKNGIIIPVDQAARTPGAFLLRVPTGDAIGHIAASQGNGKTIEAHSSKYGVCESKVDGRRWSYGILIPGVKYEEMPMVITKPPILVYRLKTPFMKDDYVGKIQRALKAKGFDPKGVDNTYGKDTQSAVVAFQKKNGLIPDGEVMPGGETSKALGI